MIGIIVLLLEILYFYLILKQFEINKENKRVLLFFSIGIIICLSGIILNGSIFRYLLLPLSFWGITKILNKNNSISYLVTIFAIFLIKFIIEMSIIMLFRKINNLLIVTIIFEFISLMFSIIFSKYTKLINNKILNLWNGSKRFYFRYLFLIGINTFMFITIYNLIKMKEVF